jgi:hypothetical protein
MMKKITLFIAALLIAFVSVAQKGKKEEDAIKIPYDSLAEKFIYTNVFEIPGATAQTLYKRSKDWSIQKFSDEKFLIDETDTKLTDLGNFTINVTMEAGMIKMPIAYTVIYTVTTGFKEGKSKLDITNIKLTDNAQGTSSEQTIESFKKQMEDIQMGKKIGKRFVIDCFEQIDANIQKVITDLEKSLKGDAVKSDW